MPNDQQNSFTEADKRKLNEIKEEKHFHAANLSDEKYRDFRTVERYADLEQIEQDVEFTERVLDIPTTAELELSEEKRTQVALNLNRKKNFLLLNERSREKDSTEMEKVKETVGELEFHLQNEEFLNFKSISEIHKDYDRAILACKTYVENKNPWFPAGIKRKARVQETMRNLRKERALLLRGRELLQKGYIDREKVKTPYDLIHLELTRYRAEKKEKEEREEKEKRDAENEKDWLNDFFDFSDLNGRYVTEKQVDPDTKITKEDMKYRLLFESKLEQGSSDDVPYALFFVKKGKTGGPLNEEEGKKAAFNDRWLRDIRALRQEKTDENRNKLMADFSERLDMGLKYLTIPSAEAVNKDPSVLEKMLFRDPDQLLFLIQISTAWEKMRALCPKQMKQYEEENPEKAAMVYCAGLIGPVIGDWLSHKHHMGTLVSEEVNTNVNLNMNQEKELTDLASKKSASHMDKRIGQAKLEAMQKAFRIMDGSLTLARDVRLAKEAGKDTTYLFWRLKTGQAEKVQKVVEDQKTAGRDCPELAAELVDSITFAQRYFFRDDIRKAAEDAVKNGNLQQKADFSRTVGALLYCPKYLDTNKALNEEEQKKEEWNQKWIACFTAKQPLSEELIAQRKELMKEGLKRVLEYPIPSPAELREFGVAHFIRRDPIRYREFVTNTLGLSDLEKLDPETFKEVIPPGSAMEKKVDAMHALVSLGMHALKASPFYIYEDGENNVHGFKLPPQEATEEELKQQKAEERGNVLQVRDEYEQVYRDAMNADAMEKTEQGTDTSAVALQQLEDLKGLENKAKRFQLLGNNASKIFAAGFYIVKKKANGEPANEEEQRKADHNKTWIASWNKWVDAQIGTDMDPLEAAMEQKKAVRNIMSYYFRFMRDIARTPMPYEKEMYCSAPARIFAERDPFTYQNLQNAAEGMEPLKQLFGKEMQTVEKDLGGLAEFKKTVEELKAILSGSEEDLPTHIEEYRKNFKAMEKKQAEVLSTQAGGENTVSFRTHRKLLKKVDEVAYREVAKISGEIGKKKSVLQEKLRQGNDEEKTDSLRAPVTLAVVLKELDRLPEGELEKAAKNFSTAKKTVNVDQLSEGEVRSIAESSELVIEQLLSLDLDKMEKLTIPEITSNFRYYVSIHFLMGESGATILDFYKSAQKKYPEACKYKESDIMQLEMVLENYAPQISTKINLVLEAGNYYKEFPTEELDPEVLVGLKPEELFAMQGQDTKTRNKLLTAAVTVGTLDSVYPDRKEKILAAKEAIARKKEEEKNVKTELFTEEIVFDEEEEINTEKVIVEEKEKKEEETTPEKVIVEEKEKKEEETTPEKVIVEGEKIVDLPRGIRL